MSFACGIVTKLCASNTPSRRKRTLRFTSNREFRMLVVCGTKVARARYVLVPAPMLITKHGRTLAVIPRSTIHTSPRRGSFMDRFFFV